MHGRLAWTCLLEQRLAAEQLILAESTIHRRREDFEVILSGGSGVGGMYDLGRRLRAWIAGREFQPEHRETIP